MSTPNSLAAWLDQLLSFDRFDLSDLYNLSFSTENIIPPLGMQYGVAPNASAFKTNA